jgi:alpha-glucoside transport system substrate-binding protein
MFEDPPQCWLHRQANFITSFFPEGTEHGVDYDFFYLPPADEAYGKPFLVAGDLVAMFNDRPEVRALMEYMTTPSAVSGWLEGGGAISAHKTATQDMYGSAVDWGVAELVAQASSFRFDGSDLMPGEVGSGTFWEQMVSYVAGGTDLDAALQAIDASWPEGVAGEASVEEEQAVTAEFLERAIAGEFDGTTVTVDGAFEGNDADGVKFDESMAAFEEATGITVNYIGNKEFEASIAIRVDAGDAPDVVDFPQPGLYAGFVRSGDVIPVTDFMSEEWLSQQYNDGWREFVSIDGQETAVMHRFSGKSLVWYPTAAWDAAGYEIPETWDELMALTQTIADDGDTAWCIGIGSGAATGWPATDWTEDLMLRTTSLENYDAWVAGELPFDSPEVKNAIETWSEIWFNDDYVLGGRSSIVSTAFGDSPTPMFEDPPQCWLHRQANFITSFFPEGTEHGVDYDFFYLPPADEAYGKPFLVAGDLIAMFNDRPEVRALMEYFSTPASVSGWLEGGGAIAAHKTATRDMYGSDLDWGVSELVAQASSFRFDGSDLMPGEVGSGTFWEQMVSYVAGGTDLDSALQAIDASWPR